MAGLNLEVMMMMLTMMMLTMMMLTMMMMMMVMLKMMSKKYISIYIKGCSANLHLHKFHIFESSEV